MVTFDLEGIAAFEIECRNAVDVLVDGLRVGVAMGVSEGAAHARRIHRWKNRTGNAERATQGRVTSSDATGAEGEMVCDVPYASFLEEGTPPHFIIGNDSPDQNLHFYWVERGISFNGPIVHHPGTKPSPFMGPAYIKCEAVIVREHEKSIRKCQASFK